jgi:hypothetical protein
VPPAPLPALRPELGFGQEAAPALGDAVPEVLRRATRGEHHHDGVADLTRDREPVEVGQLDVEEDHLGAQLRGQPDCRTPVGGLADDVEALLGEHVAGPRPEPVMVVDDEEAPHSGHGGTDRRRRLQGAP